MKIKITARSVITGEGHFHNGQEPNCSDALGQHLVEIGSAIEYETKVVEDYEPVKKPPSLPLSPPAKASPKRTRKPRTKKPPQ
jgi:hypothetical protein